MRAMHPLLADSASARPPWWALLAWVGLLAGCGSEPPQGIRHVVLVVLDTTNADHLGRSAEQGGGAGPSTSTPHLDALAARGVSFSEARSNTTWTLPSTVSLLTGKHQETHGVVTAHDLVPDDLPLLTDRLDAAGFDVAFLSQMIFASERHGFDRGVDDFAYHGKNKGAPAFHAAVTDRLDRLGDGLGDGPTFSYLHFRRLHSPYDPDPAFLAPFEVGCPLADGSADVRLRFLDGERDPVLTADEQRHLTHLYRGSLREVDARVGELVELLGSRLETDTLLVVTSDHGEGLGEHGDFGHGERLHREHVHIPLIVVGPGIEPRVVRQAVSTVDVAPTLYELLEIEPPGPMEGESFVDALSGDEQPRSPVRLSARWYPGTTPEVGVVGERWTVLQRSGETPRAYDRRADAHEEHPLDPNALDDPELARLLPLLAHLRAQHPADNDQQAPGLTPEQLRELQRLGYLK